MDLLLHFILVQSPSFFAERTEQSNSDSVHNNQTLHIMITIRNWSKYNSTDIPHISDVILGNVLTESPQSTAINHYHVHEMILVAVELRYFCVNFELYPNFQLVKKKQF